VPNYHHHNIIKRGGINVKKGAFSRYHYHTSTLPGLPGRKNHYSSNQYSNIDHNIADIIDVFIDDNIAYYVSSTINYSYNYKFLGGETWRTPIWWRIDLSRKPARGRF